MRTAAGAAGLNHLLAVGDAAGSVDVWTWGRTPEATAASARQPQLVGRFPATLPAEQGGRPDAVTQVAWKGDVLVSAGDTGRLWAWNTADVAAVARGQSGSNGTLLPARLCLGSLVDGPVVTMCWDSVARQGVVLTAAGSVWSVQWGARPVRLVSGHRGDIVCLATQAAPPVTSSNGGLGHTTCRLALTCGGEERSVRVWDTTTWDQVIQFQVGDDAAYWHFMPQVGRWRNEIPNQTMDWSMRSK